MYKITFTIIFTFLFLISFGQSEPAEQILGEWISEEKDTRIEIYKNGNQFNGRLKWSQVYLESDGTTSSKDLNNNDEKLRGRNLINADLLFHFTFSDGIWDDGKMYDPKSGKTYNCLIRLRDNKLEVRSYVGIPLLGRSTFWQRVQ